MPIAWLELYQRIKTKHLKNSFKIFNTPKTLQSIFNGKCAILYDTVTWHCSPWSKWCLALRAFGVLHLSAQLPWPGGMSRCGPYMPMQRSVKINTRNRFIWDDSTFDTWFWHMGPLNLYRKICTFNFDPSYYIFWWPHGNGFRQCHCTCGEDSTERSAQKKRCPNATSFLTFDASMLHQIFVFNHGRKTMLILALFNRSSIHQMINIKLSKETNN